MLTQNELNIFYSDLIYFNHNRFNVFLEFINTLNSYEIDILLDFLIFNRKECCFTLLFIYQKFYDFKERKEKNEI